MKDSSSRLVIGQPFNISPVVPVQAPNVHTNDRDQNKGDEGEHNSRALDNAVKVAALNFVQAEFR